MKVVKKANNTIEIDDSAKNKKYHGAAIYKAYSEDGKTVVLKAGDDERLHTFSDVPENIVNENGASYGDLSQTLEALNAFVGSFIKATASSGSGSVSPILTAGDKETLWGDNDSRRLNFVRFYEDNETTEFPVELVGALNSLDWAGFNNLEVVPASAFQGSRLMGRGSFLKAKEAKVSAFKGIGAYYINKTNNNEENLVIPNLETLSAYSFSQNPNLIEAYFPKAKNVYYGVFSGCVRLNKISLPIANWVEPTAFENCVNLETLDLPQWELFAQSETGKEHRFTGCLNLRTVNAPWMWDVPLSAGSLFADSSNLSSVSMPNNKVVPHYIFMNKTKLRTVDFSGAIQIGKGSFMGASLISTLTFNNATAFFDVALKDCFNLTTLTLGKSLNGFVYSEIYGSICYCPVLTTINVPNNWSIPATGISFPACPSISKASVTSMFAKLANNTGTAKKIAFSKVVLDRLTQDEKNVAINKGYTLVETVI